MPGDGQPAVKAVGKLTVTLVAGTAGGTLAAGEDVTVELFHRGIAVKKFEVKADAAGKVVGGDVPVMPPVQALVSVKHAGLLQQVVSPELNATEPEQAIEMKVFETTEEKPAWGVSMQHVIVEWKPEGDGVRVVEMIQTNTPGDRAWLGEKDGDGRRTLAIPLPAGAENVELGGSFDTAATKLADGKIVTGGALFPGRSEYRVGYTVPAKERAVTLEIGAPAAAGHLMVVVPEDGTKVTATGLGAGMVRDMGDHQVRMFAASDLAAGKTVSLAISGIPLASASDVGHDEETAAAKPTRFTAQNITLGGAFLMVLVAIGMMLMRKPSAKKAAV
jgi:hypothetical protein